MHLLPCFQLVAFGVLRAEEFVLVQPLRCPGGENGTNRLKIPWPCSFLVLRYVAPQFSYTFIILQLELTRQSSGTDFSLGYF